MTERGITPSQTVGPFFAYCLTPDAYDARGIAGREVATADAPGARIHIEGRVLDGAGEPVPDAMIEIWQAEAQGRYPDTTGNVAFRGCGTRRDGRRGPLRLRHREAGPGPRTGRRAPGPAHRRLRLSPAGC